MGHWKKQITCLSVTREHVFFLGNGKGISQGEGKRIYSHIGCFFQIQWCQNLEPSVRLGVAWLIAPKAPTSTSQTMPEKHLLPLTLRFPKEMIKKLKKHFHMEEPYPNRSPQDTSNTIKQEELKKAGKFTEPTQSFIQGGKSHPGWLYTVQNTIWQLSMSLICSICLL